MEQKLLDYFGGDELAANSWFSKYKVKELEGEQTPDDMHQRMAAEWARKELEYQDSENDRLVEIGNQNLSEFGKKFNNSQRKLGYRDLKELYYSYFKGFKYIVPQGSIMAMLGNNFQIGSLSNCFVIGQPHDSYAGIMQKDEELAQLMKRRGGVGGDISTLRPASARVNNSAKTSTGAVSFMGRFSNTTNEVAQGGRRGALMLSIDCRHPDLLQFIKSKEDKTKITGANISVKMRNDFMEAVKADGDYVLRFPCEAPVSHIITKVLNYNELFTLRDSSSGDPVYYKKVKAKEYWELINYHAWLTGDPGLMFVDHHWDFSPDTVYEQYKGVTTNPCGEIFMQMYDACRLLALNYFSFVIKPFTKDAKFDFAALYEVAYIQQRLADTLIDLEVEKIDRIIEKIEASKQPKHLTNREVYLWTAIKKTALSSRRTGSGFTALGDTIAALGYGYDSNEALELAEGISKIKMQAELDCTIDLAIMRGTFKNWDSQKEYFTDYSNGQRKGANPFYETIRLEFPEQFERMCRFGRRNVSWSTVAPTGTVSLLTQTTSGIEPLFLPFYTRRKKINPDQPNARVDFTDDEGVQWQEFAVLHPKFKDWIQITFDDDCQFISVDELEYNFKLSPWFKSTANDIDWKKRLQMQAIVQKYTSHSISSTINLPNTATTEDIDVIYRQAYELNLKGVTVYRDGSKHGVLVTNENSSTNKTDCIAEVRPKSIPAVVHETTVRGQSYVVIVGLLDEKPYEVFAYQCDDLMSCPIPGSNYFINKESTGVYSLGIIAGTDGEYEESTVGDVVENMTDEQKAITRLISTSLRYNADLAYIVEQLDKVDGDITSFSKAINRVLKKYVDNHIISMKCEDCGGSNIIFEEGCQKCKDCGSSKCG